MNRFKIGVHSVISSMIVALLIGCGGSGGNRDSNEETASGRFIDSAVSGLDYQSTNTIGVTDGRGRFSYAIVDSVPQDLSFSFNGVDLGSAPGAPIITPLDLVAAGDTATPQVQNRARFLLMLDADDNPDNGIVLDAALRAAVSAFDWDPVDFEAADFAAQSPVVQIIADINSLGLKPFSLPSAQQARDHLESSLACQSSGIYAGSFSGEDQGQFVLWVQHQRVDPTVFGDLEPRTGVTSALIYSQLQDRLIGVLPQQGLVFDQSQSFVAGQAVNGALFEGELDRFERIDNGRWRNPVEGGSGSFSGQRVAGDSDALFRISGVFGDDTPLNSLDNTADNTGGIMLDLFADDRVSGVAVSSRGERFLLDGMLSGETITAASADGSLRIEAVFDRTGAHAQSSTVGLFGVPGFWGSWQTAADTGVLIGTACSPF